MSRLSRIHFFHIISSFFVLLLSLNTYSKSYNMVDEGISFLQAQENKDSVFTAVDQMPEFPGGNEALIKFIQENIKYPVEAKKKGIEGRVYVQFVVSKKGEVEDVKVLKGIGGGCDEEALRVIRMLPNFIPGKGNGKVVKVSLVQPIIFISK